MGHLIKEYIHFEIRELFDKRPFYGLFRLNNLLFR